MNFTAALQKYAFWVVAAVVLVLLTNRVVDALFSYQEQRAMLILLHRQQAEAAAARVGQFIQEIENQMRWLIQLPADAATLDEWHLESIRVLSQVPAITELARIDATGREQVRVSRIAVDVVGSQTDLSHEHKFAQTMASKRYYSPVYFRRGSEPYMTLAIAGAREEYGVVAAEVNLKFIWDVISGIKAALDRTSFVVDANGRLIAHPEISLVLRNIDLSHLAYVRGAIADSLSPIGEISLDRGIQDKQAFMMNARIPPLGWTLILCQSARPLDRSTLPFCVPADPISRSGAAAGSYARLPLRVRNWSYDNQQGHMRIGVQTNKTMLGGRYHADLGETSRYRFDTIKKGIPASGGSDAT